MISDHSSYAKLLNMSGKQRMLSQRISLLITQYKKEESTQIKELLNELKLNHKFLINRKLSKELENIYYQKPHNLHKILNEFIELNNKYLENKNTSDLAKIISVQNQILYSLDTVVHTIEKESKEFSDFMITVEVLIILFIALLLYVESNYIFKPMLKKRD